MLHALIPKILLSFFLFLQLSECAVAGGEGWKTENTVMELTHGVLWYADWRQTRYISDHPDQFVETNGGLGERPGHGAVDRYFARGVLVHGAASYFLPPPYRTWWQGISVTHQAGVVVKNIQIGIKF